MHDSLFHPEESKPLGYKQPDKQLDVTNWKTFHHPCPSFNGYFQGIIGTAPVSLSVAGNRTRSSRSMSELDFTPCFSIMLFWWGLPSRLFAIYLILLDLHMGPSTVS